MVTFSERSRRMLANHAHSLADRTLRQLFDSDLGRFADFSLTQDDMWLDFARNPLTTETLGLLVDFVRTCNLEQARDARFAGMPVNRPGKFPVLHTSLRHPESGRLTAVGRSGYRNSQKPGHIAPAVMQHVAGDEDEDDDADIVDPCMADQQLADDRGKECHKYDRHRQADDQKQAVALGDAGDGKDIVDRHGDIGHDDEAHRAQHRGAVAAASGRVGGNGHLHRIRSAVAGEVEQFPRHPEKCDSAKKFDPCDFVEIGRGQRRGDADEDRHRHAEQDRPALQMRGQG